MDHDKFLKQHLRKDGSLIDRHFLSKQSDNLREQAFAFYFAKVTLRIDEHFPFARKSQLVFRVSCR